MRKTILSILVLLLAYSNIQAKGKWTLESGTSFGFHYSDIYLWNYKVENSASFGLNAGLGYEQFFTKKTGLSINFQYHQLFNTVHVGDEKISGTNYVLKIPIHGHYHFDKYEVFGGVSVQNYREIKDMALQKSYNLRWQAELGFTYSINELWSLKASYSHLVSPKYDSLLSHSFSDLVNIGVRLNLSELFKKKGTKNE